MFRKIEWCSDILLNLPRSRQYLNMENVYKNYHDDNNMETKFEKSIPLWNIGQKSSRLILIIISLIKNSFKNRIL